MTVELQEFEHGALSSLPMLATLFLDGNRVRRLNRIMMMMVMMVLMKMMIMMMMVMMLMMLMMMMMVMMISILHLPLKPTLISSSPAAVQGSQSLLNQFPDTHTPQPR